MANKNIRICTWNANGLISRISEVKEFINRQKIDIFIINDTRLKETTKIKFKNYICLRKDNTLKCSGGILILIKSSIAHKEVTINDDISIECLGIKLPTRIYIIGVYNNPSNHFQINEIDKLLKMGNKILIVGDLNARHPPWNNTNPNSKGRKIYNYVSRNNCSILYPNEHTHYPTNGQPASTIDIAFNKNVRDISETIVLHKLSSDHNLVTIELGAQQVNATDKVGLNYKKANWKAFRQRLNQEITINSKINTTEQIEKEVQQLTNRIQNAVAETIPTKSLKAMQDEIPEYIKEMIRKRNKTRKCWQKYRLDFIKRAMYNETINIRKAITEHRNNEWERKLKKLNPKDNSIWTMTKALKTEYKLIPTLFKNNIEAITDEEKVEMFADQFEKVHSINLINNTIEQNMTVLTE